MKHKTIRIKSKIKHQNHILSYEFSKNLKLGLGGSKISNILGLKFDPLHGYLSIIKSHLINSKSLITLNIIIEP